MNGICADCGEATDRKRNFRCRQCEFDSRRKGWEDRPPFKGCYEWTGTFSDTGHPVTKIKEKRRQVRRLVWDSLVGPIPRTYSVVTKCGNSKCILINHLALNKSRNGPPRIVGDVFIGKEGYQYLVCETGPARPFHRVLFEQKIGRQLESWENVHHKNGVRHDNSMENLELWVVKQPKGQRAYDLVKWAKEILDTYGNEEEKWA